MLGIRSTLSIALTIYSFQHQILTLQKLYEISLNCHNSLPTCISV